jgi:hypothetical protein
MTASGCGTTAVSRTRGPSSETKKPPKKWGEAWGTTTRTSQTDNKPPVHGCTPRLQQTHQ